MYTQLTSIVVKDGKAKPVAVETKTEKGLGLQLVGLADCIVKENLLRSVAAIVSSGYTAPGVKILIKLAPSDTYLSGTGFNLAISVGILASVGKVTLRTDKDFLIAGELTADGKLQDVDCNPLSLAEMAEKLGLDGCILPKSMAQTATDMGKKNVFGFDNFTKVIEFLTTATNN